MRIADMLVQNGEEHDDSLHMKAAAVNMRLFESNATYRSIIMRTIHLMKQGARIEFEDYPKAQGVSGANVGVPFNIVIIVTKEGNEVFINPEVMAKSTDLVEVKSNCGSLNLPEPIAVVRQKFIEVKWFDVDGKKHREVFEIGDKNKISSATLQHEIDHNLGILITEREVKDEK